MPTNLKDVAKHAGVSIATASRALRNAPNVNSATKEKVQIAAEQLNYQPHLAAQNLIGARWAGPRTLDQDIIAVVYTTVRNPEFIPHIRQAIERAGYQAELFEIRNESDIQTVNRVLEAKSIQAAIAWCRKHEVEQIVGEWKNIAFTLMGDIEAATDWNEVYCDYHYGLRLAVEKMIQRGYRRIGVRLVFRRSHPSHHYAMGAALIEQELRPEIISVASYPETLQTTEFLDKGAESAVRWIEKYNLDAILWPHSQIRRQLEEIGVDIPKDIGLAALSGMGSTVSAITPWLQLPQVAVSLVRKELKEYRFGKPKHPQRISVAPTWFEGATL